MFDVKDLDYVKTPIGCYLGILYTKVVLGINIVNDVWEVLTLCEVADMFSMKFDFVLLFMQF